MKLHKPLVAAVTTTLQKIFSEGVYADKAVEQVLKLNHRWGSRDRRFIAETTYEMVRWWRLILESGNIFRPETNADYYRLFGIWLLINNRELPDWEEFEAINKLTILENYEKVKKIRKIRESVPDWLDALGALELGAEVWEKELHELNREAKVVLRVNLLKIKVDELQKKLGEKDIVTQKNKLYPDALILEKRQNLYSLNEYQQGLFEIQDASSQLITPFMQVKPGMFIVDACAGAGGKSLHMAAAMQNKGKIISMDVEERKLKELQKRADRGGATIIFPTLISDHAIQNLKNTADRLLLDVPCSGLGVIRRNPDAKWKLSSEFVEKVKIIQQEIITRYSSMVKPGGIMVYATCSILPGENQNQVQSFMEKANNDFELIEDQVVMPSEGFDGFYMAKILKK